MLIVVKLCTAVCSAVPSVASVISASSAAAQAALEALCGATPAAELHAHKALLPAWQAVAHALRLCSEVL